MLTTKNTCHVVNYASKNVTFQELYKGNPLACVYCTKVISWLVCTNVISWLVCTVLYKGNQLACVLYKGNPLACVYCIQDLTGVNNHQRM